MEPVTTSKVPAIIRKCGNFKVAKRDSHAVSANFFYSLGPPVDGATLAAGPYNRLCAKVDIIKFRAGLGWLCFAP